MKLRRTTTQSRSAFTLVELLVVITIIVILMSLLLTGVNKIFAYVDEVRTTTEINQLADACETFKARFGRYPPSRIVLAAGVGYNALANPANDANAQLQRESVEYLQAIFPGINPNSGTHDWSGNGRTGNPPVPNVKGLFYLEGQECLVYFLGGIRYGNSGFSGFCADPLDPTNNNLTLPGARRNGPFFEFNMTRITMAGNPNATANPGSKDIQGNPRFYVYQDIWTTPYAFFAARAFPTNNYATTATIQQWGYTTNTNVMLDCNNLLSTPNTYDSTANAGTSFPYVQNLAPTGPNGTWVATYHRASTFQIVSAGKDKDFGSISPALVFPQNQFGCPWIANSDNPFLTKPASDNITNFSGGVLVSK